jgi:transcriptional regulator
MPSLAPLPTVAARGELYRLNRAHLAFTNEEAREFFAACGLPPDPYDDELNALARGWPLALRFFAAARVDSGATQHEPIPPERLLERIAPQLDAYLAREALGDLPFDLRTWLLGTALMRWIDESACAAVAELADRHIDLKIIERYELFVETLPDGRSVYQPLQAASFARLAERELPNWRRIHAQLGQYYAAKGDDHGAAHHFLAAAQWEEASEALSRMALAGVSGAQAVALLSWIEQIPTDHRNNAALLEARAIAERRLGRYAQALESYRLAEERYRARGDADGQVRALRGQAEVYIDTVQPAPAAVLLKRAMKLLPRHRRAERATILSLQAENWINRGRADVAIFIIAAAHREAYGRTSHSDAGGSSPRRSPFCRPACCCGAAGLSKRDVCSKRNSVSIRAGRAASICCTAIRFCSWH